MKEIVVIPATKDYRMFGNKNKLMKVASYSRVSTNFEEQLTSFELQKAYYTDLILKTKGWTLAGTYADEGISGVTEKRPDFQKLMRHCRKGKIDLIITKSVSRFSRNILITIKSVRELKSLGIAVYFEKENINTLEENSEFVLSLMATMAQEESHSLSKNVRKGIQMKFQQGIVDWNYTQSYGFKEGENKQPEIVEEHAEIIRAIYRYYLSGESDNRIAQKLNDEKIKTPRGNELWLPSTIQGILQYERYCGDVILQKTYIENHITKKVKVNNGEYPKIHIKNNHKAIVTRETFERALKERARRNSKKSVSKNTITDRGKFSSMYALSEILVCGDCLSPMQRVVWTKQKRKGQEKADKQPVWRCTKRIKYGKEYCGDSVTVDEESLHIAIMKAINATSKSRNNIIKFVREEVEISLMQRKNDEFDLSETQYRIEEIKNKITEMVENGTVVENLELIKSMNQEAVKLNDMVDKYKLSYQNTSITSDAEEIERFLISEQSDYDTYDDKLVRQIIDTIKVINEQKIIVCFRNGLEYEQEMEVKVKPRNK